MRTLFITALVKKYEAKTEVIRDNLQWFLNNMNVTPGNSGAAKEIENLVLQLGKAESKLATFKKLEKELENNG